jgi:adenosine deaminase
MKIGMELLRKLPKVDIHCHLDGSVRTGTILELARAQKIKLPADNAADLAKYVHVSPDCRNLTEFLKVFDYLLPVLKTHDAVERISYELCEDCASENVKYVEVRFAPYLQATDDFSMDEVVTACLSGLKRGAADFGIKTGVILCCMRSVPEQANVNTVELAKKYFGKGVVAVDLAGDEFHFPTENFSVPFALAAKYGIPFTIHAGEASGPGSIKAALELGASRIGHGVRLVEDKLLLAEIRDRKIPLEVCITSNIQTSISPDFASHPVSELYKSGVAVTINTDDRSVSNIDLTNEYDIFANGLGFGMNGLEKIIFSGISALFAPEHEKSELKKRFAVEIDSLAAEKRNKV